MRRLQGSCECKRGQQTRVAEICVSASSKLFSTHSYHTTPSPYFLFISRFPVSLVAHATH